MSDDTGIYWTSIIGVLCAMGLQVGSSENSRTRGNGRYGHSVDLKAENEDDECLDGWEYHD